jgi:hypothetical protein
VVLVAVVSSDRKDPRREIGGWKPFAILTTAITNKKQLFIVIVRAK